MIVLVQTKILVKKSQKSYSICLIPSYMYIGGTCKKCQCFIAYKYFSHKAKYKTNFPMVFQNSKLCLLIKCIQRFWLISKVLGILKENKQNWYNQFFLKYA